MRADDRGIVLGLHRSSHLRVTLEAALGLGVQRLDTAFNYLNFASHSTLARVAGDLLGEFEISTKVGFFPEGHSLDPVRLRRAVQQSAADLGRTPDLVFLHNPERSLDGLPPSAGADILASATTALAETKTQGITRAWGISTWRPGILTPYAKSRRLPIPDVLMTRCGLTVSDQALRAAEDLTELLRITHASRWGMAPFGGDTEAVPWPAAHTFAPGEQEPSPVLAAFAAAYHLPEVSTIAVGADQPAHLVELVAAVSLDIDQNRIAAYRALLADREATVTQ
ncbi:aldo/keto reductase [Actinomadura sp. KC216]|nr:aldo/keto reductase [Actinomadura sp. KC216]